YAQRRSAPESRKRREQRLTVGAPEPGARIPAGRRLVGAVVAFGDVAEGPRADAVERGVNVAERPAELLVVARDQRGPERRDRARAPDHIRLAVDPHLVAGERVRVARHVRNTAPGDAVGRLGHRNALLPGRQRKHLAHAAAGGTLVDARLV